MNAGGEGNVWELQLEVETRSIALISWIPYVYVRSVAIFHHVVSALYIKSLFIITLALHLKYAIELCSKFKVVFNHFAPMFL